MRIQSKTATDVREIVSFANRNNSRQFTYPPHPLNLTYLLKGHECRSIKSVSILILRCSWYSLPGMDPVDVAHKTTQNGDEPTEGSIHISQLHLNCDNRQNLFLFVNTDKDSVINNSFIQDSAVNRPIPVTSNVYISFVSFALK